MCFCLQAVLEQVCRLARVIASPHEVAHTVLVAEGCAGRCSIIAQLSAHLCGYTVVKINPISPTATKVQHMEHFQADLVAAYTRAGVKVGQDYIQSVPHLTPCNGFNIQLGFETCFSNIPCLTTWFMFNCISLLILFKTDF